MKPDQVKLTVTLDGGNTLSCVYDYTSAALRVVEAKGWGQFRGYTLEGPASQLAELMVVKLSGAK